MRTSLELYSLKHRIFLVKNYYQEFGNSFCIKSNYEEQYGSNNCAPAFSEDAMQEVISLFEDTGSVWSMASANINKSAIQEDRNPERVNLPSRGSFSCKICRQTFLYRNNLKRHILDTHEIQDAYKCDICSVDLRKKHKFLKHMRSHEENPLKDIKGLFERFKQCEECGKMCSIFNYNEHIKLHSGNRHYRCDVCGKVFTWECWFKLHKMQHEGIVEKNPPKCVICGQAMTTNRTLKRHMEMVHPTVRTSRRFNVVIENCSEELDIKAEKEEVVEQIEIEDASEPQAYHSEAIVALPLEVDPIDIATDEPQNQDDSDSDEYPGGDEFFEEAMATVETPSVDVTPDDSALCELCGKVFRERNLRKHLIMTHTEGLPYKCPVEGCNKAYKLRTSYQWHKTSHNKTKGKPHKCMFCDKSYMYSFLLKNHLRDRHRDSIHYCESCDRVFIEKSEYVLHLRKYHNVTEDDPPPKSTKPSKPIPTCMICGKTVKYKQNMKKHIKSHAKAEEALKCPEPGCGRSFPIDKYLKLHMMRHRGQRFKCAHCDKDYADRSQMKRHITQVHLKEKPKYTCDYCDYSTWQALPFKNHVKRHHGKDITVPTRNFKYKTTWRNKV